MKNGTTIFLFICAVLVIGFILVGEINFQSIATDSGFDVGYSSGGSSGGSGGGHSSSSSSGGSGDFSIGSLLASLAFFAAIIGIYCLLAKIGEYLEKKHLLHQVSFGCSTIFLQVFLSFFVLPFLMIPFSLSNVVFKIILVFLIVTLWLVILIYVGKNMWKKYKGDIKIERIIRKSKKFSLELTQEEKKILQKGYQIYLDVQRAWMNFDYEWLRTLVTDELFNMYQNQLKELELKNQQNIMESFKLEEYHLLSLKNENDVTTIEMVLKVAFFDYIVNKDKKVIRGTKGRRVTMTYLLTFVSNEKAIATCPHCGAKIENGNTVCEYCGTTIQVNNQMKLAKKEVLSQK